jgi:hypothetical protein
MLVTKLFKEVRYFQISYFISATFSYLKFSNYQKCILQNLTHKPTDTVDKINFELCEKRVRMIFYTAWEIANRDKMLNRDKPLDSGTR